MLVVIKLRRSGGSFVQARSPLHFLPFTIKALRIVGTQSGALPESPWGERERDQSSERYMGTPRASYPASDRSPLCPPVEFTPVKCDATPKYVQYCSNSTFFCCAHYPESLVRHLKIRLHFFYLVFQIGKLFNGGDGSVYLSHRGRD